MSRARALLIPLVLVSLSLHGCDSDEPSPGPDLALPDGPGTLDASLDQTPPDQTLPDQTLPDQTLPDMTLPDQLLPDMPPPTCTDGKKNGSETDIDCGGGTCPTCAKGKGCSNSTDCVSGVCAAGKCLEATCTDTVKNGAETDVDCGGGTCPACAAGKGCAKAADCKSGVCNAGKCLAASCTDTVKNGVETDVDCGGGTCPACAMSKGCAKAADCKSGVCSAGKCVAASCTDGIKNGSETDTDCGGGSCSPCIAGKGCGGGADCKSGVCTAGKCVSATCTDSIKNGGETDVDCGGGACPSCLVGKACGAASDCKSGVCVAGKCAAATCTDSIKNGGETDVDCGGGACPSCLVGKACGAASDCQSGVCVAGKCAAATCTDGVKNGSETDTDCGGSSCAGCKVGGACKKGTDCISGACSGGKCITALTSCRAILAALPSSKDGVYTIDPDGAGSGAPFSAYCDMTTDGGGWTLLATLHTHTTWSKTIYNPWSDDWWIKKHGTPEDPTKTFSNHDARLFAPLVNGWMVLRASTPNNGVKRFHFGFANKDWGLWNKSRTSSNSVNIIGPFNLSNVKVSTKVSLSGAVQARSNGHWYDGVFYLGTAPGGGETDGEGLGARFHVGSNVNGSWGYVGGARAKARWHLWVRDGTSYYKSCAEVRKAGKGDGTYELDPDGAGGAAPVKVYCPASSAGVAPVGMCQAESGGAPGCRSYVGAAGFSFSGVNFAGMMTYTGAAHKVGTTSVQGNRGILRTGAGTTFSVSYSKANFHRTLASGTHSQIGSGLSNPHGIIQLFDKNIMVGDIKRPRVFTTAGALVTDFGPSTLKGLYPTQMSNGEIWSAQWSGTTVQRLSSTGTLLGTISHAAFVEYVSQVVQLADGNVLISCHGKNYPGKPGRFVWFTKALKPITFSSAPAGMILNSDGSLSHKDVSGQHELIQLPNGLILVAGFWTNRFVRLKPTGEYVDSLILGSGCSGNGCAHSPSGMFLDTKGQLVFTTGSNAVRVLTFGK